MEDCVFCKIISGQIPTDFVYQDEKVVAFKDIKPSAPVHILVAPKEHYRTLNEVEDKELLGELMFRLKEVAKKQCLEGYKVAINVGKDGGQEVPHLHFHLLGGWSKSEG